MSRRGFIKRKVLERLTHPGTDYTLTMPGEPLIYSIRYSLGCRLNTAQYFQTKQFFSILKSVFLRSSDKKIPVVVIARFFVRPPSDFPSMSDKQLEKIPAVEAYEVCDYLLHLLEIIRPPLLGSYRQVVKIETDKYYSNEPRIELKVMRYCDYENLYDRNTVLATSKSFDKAKHSRRKIQPKRQANAQDKGVCAKATRRCRTAANEGTGASDCSLSTTSASAELQEEGRELHTPPTCKET